MIVKINTMEYKTLKTTGSDNVGNYEAVKTQDETLTLRLIEENDGHLAGEKTMNFKQPIHE